VLSGLPTSYHGLPNSLGLGRREVHGAVLDRPQFLAGPICSHEAEGRVRIRGQQQMPELVGDHRSQEHRLSQLSIYRGILHKIAENPRFESQACLRVFVRDTKRTRILIRVTASTQALAAPLNSRGGTTISPASFITGSLTRRPGAQKGYTKRLPPRAPRSRGPSSGFRMDVGKPEVIR
jgi:hypothetical protein